MSAPPPVLVRRPPPVLANTPALPLVSAGRMSIKNKVSGILVEPLRLLIYGPEKVGKTSFAANAPNAIILGTEEGSAELDVDRFPTPTSWADVLEAIVSLRDEQHEYKTLVVDSLDWLEPLLWADLCRQHCKESIESFGYGKGYQAAVDAWRIMLARLSELRDKKIDVILIAHSWVKSFKNPDAIQGDYDRYELKLNNKAAGLFKEWAKAVLFAQYETNTVERPDGRKVGVQSGRNVLYTQKTAAYDAGNRFGLPKTLPLAWSEFAKALEASAALRTELSAALKAVPEEVAKIARAAIEVGGYDPAHMATMVKALKEKAKQ